MDRIAIIDLGTNTFHILIVDASSFLATQEVVYREREYVFLGKGNKEKIDHDSYLKGIDTLIHFSQLISKYRVDKIIALGTEALRKTSNGPAFCAEVLSKTSINIEIIDGLQEAALIAKGVSLLDLPKGDHLVMDIGGGSVEFIHLKNKKVQWAQSFKIGISVLYNSFQTSEPISPDDLNKLDAFLDLSLQSLWNHLEGVEPSLIGASGTFEVLISTKTSGNELVQIEQTQVSSLYETLLSMNLEERTSSGLIAKERAKYIVVALHLVLFVCSRLTIKKAFISPYAMKEGALAEAMNLD